ncbi:MAG: hypothetical protein M1457_03660 [bacterium]|nr:hypothetical protein [bacterium]
MQGFRHRAGQTRRIGQAGILMLRYYLVFLTLLTMAAFSAATGGAAEPAWSDGTPIIRFDKQSPPLQLVRAEDWTGVHERRWAGPTIWTNRIEDWVCSDGTLTCAVTDPLRLTVRSAHLLTWELGARPEPFRLETVLTMAGSHAFAGYAGFLVGAGQGRLDYRGASLVHGLPGRGGGILAVVETRGEGGLSFRDFGVDGRNDPPLLEGQRALARAPIRLDYHRMIVELEGAPAGDGRYDLRLSVWAENAGTLLGAQELRGVPADRLRGNVALISAPGRLDVHHNFERFRVGGGRFESHPERTFGPVAGTLYSVSGNTLKLSAQFMHLGQAYGKRVARRLPRLAARLEARPAAGAPADPEAGWTPVARPHSIQAPDYLVLFRVNNWDASRDWETRVVFTDERGTTYTYTTLVRRDPRDKLVVVAAGFTGMGAMGLNAESPAPKPPAGDVLVGRWTPANVCEKRVAPAGGIKAIDPDVLFFTGDQVYEMKPTNPPVQNQMPVDDYLYKWILWYWSFNSLTSQRPALCQTDDHDIYQGNLWGWGGNLSPEIMGNDGYSRSSYFVNMVQRTQTAHNPDAFDPGPADTGIFHYYSGFAWGGVGWAVIEDRKFKSPPFLANELKDPAKLEQLGPRQLQFLKQWGEDWTGQQFKVVVSQTLYASIHVSPQEKDAGEISADTDTNGWPKPARDRSVGMFQRCGAYILCGDLHLASLARLGIARPSDAVYQFCVPPMGNIFWRWFYPAVPGSDRKPGEPEYTGEFTDPHGNYFRVLAVANPERRELLNQNLRQRFVLPKAEAVGGKGDLVRLCQGDGYGILRLDKTARTITAECWPHNADPASGKGQFPGWPVTVPFDQLDGRQATAWLPDLKFEGFTNPVIQIVDQRTGEAIKITRAGAENESYRPGVFAADGIYTLRVGVPETNKGWWEARDLKPTAHPGARALKVSLPR